MTDQETIAYLQSRAKDLDYYIDLGELKYLVTLAELYEATPDKPAQTPGKTRGEQLPAVKKSIDELRTKLNGGVPPVAFKDLPDEEKSRRLETWRRLNDELMVVQGLIATQRRYGMSMPSSVEVSLGRTKYNIPVVFGKERVKGYPGPLPVKDNK